jgi:transposase
VSGLRHSRTTIIVAYSNNTLIAPFRFNGYTNTAVFNQWLKHILVPELKAGQVVILDNASFHKSLKTKQIIEDAGCRILYLPPYSPDLNPIEKLWSNLKYKIRSLYTTITKFFIRHDYSIRYFCKL